MAGWITPAVWTGAEIAYGEPGWPKKQSAAPFTAPANTTALALNEAGEWSVVWVDGFPGNGFVGRFAGYSATGFAENGDRSFVVKPNQGFRFDTWAIFAITDTPDEGGGAVSSVFGRTGDVVATSGDYAASLIENDSNVTGSSVADALDNLAEEVEGLETTVSGHTAALDGKSAVGHGHAIADISGLQSALDGKASTAVATTGADGLLSASDKAKLDGIASGATAGPSAYNSTPTQVSTGAGSAGSSAQFAKGDHTHQLPARTFTNLAQKLGGWAHNPAAGFSMGGAAGAGVYPTQQAVPTSGDRWHMEIDLPVGALTLTNVRIALQAASGHSGMPSVKPEMLLYQYTSAGGVLSYVGAITDPSASVGAYEAIHTFTLVLSHNVDLQQRYVVHLVGESGSNALGGLKILGLSISGTYQ